MTLAEYLEKEMKQYVGYTIVGYGVAKLWHNAEAPFMLLEKDDEKIKVWIASDDEFNNGGRLIREE